MAKNTNGRQKLSQVQRRVHVRRYAAMGMSSRTIAEVLATELGYYVSHVTVSRDIKAIVEELQSDSAEAMLKRTLDLEMLGLMLAANAEGALDGSPEPTDHVLKIIDRRSKLYGYEALEAPRELEPVKFVFEVVERRDKAAQDDAEKEDD